MGEILELAEALWNGEKDTYSFHPFGFPRGMELIDTTNSQRTWFYRGFSNSIIRETDDGLIIVDPGAIFDVNEKFAAVKKVTLHRLHTAIFSHGHIDHVGVKKYLVKAEKEGWAKPRLIGHENIIKRFNRYKKTQSWHEHINLRQFAGRNGKGIFPTDFYYPDLIYHDKLSIEIGGVRIKLNHARGETDDHTWAYFPDSNILCTGDLFIWGIPNAGNPQKVQRYAKEWADALREMENLHPEILCPGHGVPIIGADRVKEALIFTAGLLESLQKQTIDLMNSGASLDRIIHTVKTPVEFSKKPYLKPIYDEPEFIVRNCWRLYGGWYDGTPSHLKPAPEIEQAKEISKLAGGAKNLVMRGLKLSNAGNHRMACHLAEWAHLSSPDDNEVCEIASKIFIARAKAETSTMAIGIFLSAARNMGGKPEEEMAGNTVVHAQELRGKK